MPKKKWINEFHENIIRGKENLKEKDLRFFHIERLIKIAEHIEKNSDECAECMKLKIPVLELSANLSRYMHGRMRERAYYENIFDQATHHMKKTHALYPPFHFNYLYTFIGFVLGAFSGTTIYLLSGGIAQLKLILILALTGLLIGQVTGRKKDNLVRMEGRKL